MPPKKKLDTATATPVNERMILATNIQKLTRAQEDFTRAVDEFEKINKQTLEDLDLDITNRKLEIEDLTVQKERNIRDAKIEFSQTLAEHRKETIYEVLKELDQTAIDESELNSLREQLTEIDERVSAASKDATDRAKRDFHFEKNSIEMKHKAENAELTAKITQQSETIKDLRNTIEDLKKQIDSQRELTRQVAESSRQSVISMPGVKA